MKKDVGLLLLGVWLILQGLISLVDFQFSGLSTVMALLALAAGGLIVLKR
jgi:hypothetical protein